MLKFLATFSLALTLLLPAPVASAQCLLCGVIGFALGSAGGDQYGAGGGNIIYIAPRISERLRVDPLQVRIVASDLLLMQSSQIRRGYQGGGTIQDIFAASVPESEKYTVLEVVRVIDPGSNWRANFWFAYIEKEHLRPLSELPLPID